MKDVLKKFETPQSFIPNFLVRDRIINLLNEMINYKVVFVSAISGYGKTLEVLSWTKQVDKQCCYVKLKKEDTCKTVCKRINKECNLNYMSLEQMAFSISKEKQEKEKVIILDDFEYIANNKIVLGYIANIIQNSNNNIRFIIISEGALPNEFKPFLFAQHLICIKNKELAFTNGEIKLYLENNDCYLTEKELDKLYRYSAGMPVYLNSFLSEYNENNKIVNDELFDTIKKDMVVYLDCKLAQILSEEHQDILIKVARIDEFDINLMATEERKNIIKESFNQIYNLTGILKEKGLNKYVMLDFYKNYYLLKNLTEKEQDEIDNYYIRAAQKYINESDYIKAIEVYIKARKYDEAIEIIKKLTLLNETDIYSYHIIRFLEMIPQEYKNNSLIMYWYLYIKSIIEYDIMQINESYAKINELVSKKNKNTKEYYEAIRIGIFAKMLLPTNTPKMLLKPLKIFTLEHKENLKRITAVNITESQTSLLAGRKDFSEFSLHINILKPILKKAIKEMQIIKMEGFLELVNGEVCYQKNEISKALDFVGKGIVEIRKNDNLRLEFVGDVLNLKILFLTSKSDLFDKIMFEVKNKLKDENNKMFLKNLEAEKIIFDLKNGKLEEAKIWLETEAPNIVKNFSILEKCRYNAKVRAYIAVEEYTGALIILKRLEPYFVENKRIFSIIENYILQSICLEKNGDEKDMLIYIEKAIILAQKYQYIRVFADEGLVMNKILSKYKSKIQNKSVNLSFLDKIIDETKIFGNSHPLLYAVNKINLDIVTKVTFKDHLKPIDDLSVTEKNVLNLICSGLKNHEIAETMNISMSTVKTHINHIFSKLGVKNRVQAINEARKRKLF